MPAAGNVLPLAVTMGEPAGIGSETTLMAWRDLHKEDSAPAFFAIDDPDRLGALADRAGIDVPVAEIKAPEDAKALFQKVLPVLPHSVPVSVSPGAPDPGNGEAVLQSIARAVDIWAAGEAGAVVTTPVHKDILMHAGFTHPGQTEFLGELGARHTAETPTPVMMLACPGLRVVPATVHMALAGVPSALSEEKLFRIGEILQHEFAARFDIEAPRIAFAGLNPHAGENGQFGREEIEIIQPAIARLRDRNIDAQGPFPADSLFHGEARARFDTVVCMYHDQALIPLKTLDFYGGVNATLGLPFVRTSPDHGTAFDIAGQGKANPSSMIAALKLAAELAANEARHAGK